jgi:putative DNA primase/helicase
MSAKHDPEAAMRAAGVREIPARDSGVVLLRADQVKSAPVAWLWQGWLARAKVHIFGGDPGAGKTTIALDLAAIITRGGRWPDGSMAEPGDVLFWSGEDDIADTLRPRLARAGADLARVHFIAGVSEDGKKRAFDPAMDMAELSEAIGRMQRPAMLVIDPLVAMVTGEDKGNAPVRRNLQPLTDLATERRVAVVGIHHLSKGTQGRKPLERVTGSLAFGALARIVFFAARGEGKDGSEPERLLVRVKSNIGPDGDGFRYALEQAPLADDLEISASGIAWGAAVEGRAGDLLAQLEGLEPGKGDSPALSEAKGFLLDMLTGGPMLTTALTAEAKGAGISPASLRRAKDALGVQAEKAPGDGPWRWRLPERSP